MTHEHHHHHPGCTCGHSHAPVHVSERAAQMVLGGREEAILKTIGGAGCLPVARLIATKSDEEEVVIDCLSPVYLYDAADTLEEVKEIGALLKGLEEKELLTLDYDRPIKGYDYALYTQSDLYAYFVRTLQEARGREGFLCDTPEIELGSMALTELGEQVCARDL